MRTRSRSSADARSDDLADLIRSGRPSKSNGNHTIEVITGLAVPNFDLCQSCELNLRCLGGAQINAMQALEANRPCVRHRNLIEFRYHGTVCLTCDIAAKTVTDHGMYGYSVTTSGNIRKYLHALANNFPEFNLTGKRIGELITAFKVNTRKGDVWHHI